MAPFHYERLLGARSFRLMTIHPGAGPGVRIDIHNEELSAGHIMGYEALSYTWGVTSDKVDIFVGENQHTLGVTRNLEAALRVLAAEHTQQRTFWIDAVCINQEDLKERSQQVKIMTEIYRSAGKVVAWIGPGSRESHRTIDRLKTFAKSIELDWRIFKITSRSSRLWAHVVSEMLDEPVFISDLEELLFRTWFERLWIWQEIRVASDRAIVKCGQDEIDWNDFHKVIFAFRAANNPRLSKAVMRRMAVVVQMKNMASSTTLVSLSSWTRKAKCGDQRDRIYAIQGMIQKREATLIEPDYTRSEDDVFRDVAMKYITKLNSLELLTCCRFDIRKESLPTWVPNWSSENGRKFAQIMNPDASGKSACEVTIIQERYLRLMSKQCCVVRKASKLWDAGAQEIDAVRAILQITRDLDASATYIDGSCVLEALAIAFELGSVAENFEPIPVSHLLRTEQATKFLNQILVDNSPRVSCERSELERYIAALTYKLEGWSFFTTESGLIGLSPADLRPGDIISLFLGARSLMALREAANGKHQILAECYVHGLMHTEGLLGPVPQGYRRVAKLDESTNGYHRCWRKQSDGEASFQLTDPRLASLPVGWRLKRHKQDHLIDHYENPVTGEGMSSDMEADPRLRSGDLLRCGVKMTMIELC